MAAWTFLPIAANMMIMTRQYTAIMAPWRIPNQHTVVVLAWLWWFISALVSIGDRLHVPVDCFDRQFHAAICGMHLQFAIFANSHAIPFRWSCSISAFRCLC